MKRNQWFAAFGLCVAVVLITEVPYLIADKLALPSIFGGFLINPLDGYSYLAKMRQGAQGSWLFRLPYAAEPGPGAFVFVYYLFLGHLSEWLNAPLLTVYHAVRIAAAMFMFILAYIFFHRFLPEKETKWSAFGITLVGSGLGWLAIAFGFEASDLAIPESIPFLAAYSNAHFPLAAATILGGILAVSESGSLKGRVLSGIACGVLLGVVLPFSVISLTVALSVWMVWEIHREGWRIGGSALWSIHHSRFLPFLGLLAGAGPWLVYDYWLTLEHPVIAAWSSQNQTPSPPLLHYGMGFGLILIFAVVGVLKGRPHRLPHGRLMLSWVFSNALLLYMPFNLQRRLSLGLFFPLAALAALGLKWIAGSKPRLKVLFIVVLLLSIPSNLIVIGAGLAGVGKQDPMLVHSRPEIEAYDWLSRHASFGELILAAPETGNRLPAFANVRVLYGHPFETPDAIAQEKLVEDLFQGKISAEEAQDLLIARGVDFVFYGDRERELGEPEWVQGLIRVFSSGDTEIYRVPYP